MNYEQFIKSLEREAPPEELTALAKALWYDGIGDWESSHRIVQDLSSKAAAQIHAYLHRKEGDLWNADYWYRQSDTVRPDTDLQTEWKALVKLHLK